MPAIARSRVMIPATDGFEQSELQVPLERPKETGAFVAAIVEGIEEPAQQRPAAE